MAHVFFSLCSHLSPGFREECRLSLPPGTDRHAEQLLARDRMESLTTTALTAQQQCLFKQLFPCRGGEVAAAPRRVMVQAAAGTGKTVLAVKFVAQALLGGPAVGVFSGEHLLLVTHSEAVLGGPMALMLVRELGAAKLLQQQRVR